MEGARLCCCLPHLGVHDLGAGGAQGCAAAAAPRPSQARFALALGGMRLLQRHRALVMVFLIDKNAFVLRSQSLR